MSDAGTVAEASVAELIAEVARPYIPETVQKLEPVPLVAHDHVTDTFA